MEQILFLLLVGVVALVRWIMQMAEAQRNKDAQKRAQNTPAPNAPVPRAPAESEEERMRKFFEALGVPTSSPPAKGAEPRREVAPKTPRPPKGKIFPLDPFPAPRPVTSSPTTTTPPVAKPPTTVFVPGMPAPPVIEEVIAAPKETKVTVAMPAVFEVREVAPEAAEEAPRRQPVQDAYRDSTLKPAPLPASVNWQVILRSSNGLRDAMILREIFGPPRSIQPL